MHLTNNVVSNLMFFFLCETVNLKANSILFFLLNLLSNIMKIEPLELKIRSYAIVNIYPQYLILFYDVQTIASHCKDTPNCSLYLRWTPLSEVSNGARGKVLNFQNKEHLHPSCQLRPFSIFLLQLQE